MSDALNYLIAARPDAVLPYFKMLKEAGKHLDTRTRDLISVITKVDVQTDAGFRQYLTRALRNGASANEVLDGRRARSIRGPRRSRTPDRRRPGRQAGVPCALRRR